MGHIHGHVNFHFLVGWWALVGRGQLLIIIPNNNSSSIQLLTEHELPFFLGLRAS